MKYFFVCISVICILLIACQSEIETSTDYERIVIDPNELVESDTISDFFEKMSFVPLCKY